jgi:hypothetical protein
LLNFAKLFISKQNGAKKKHRAPELSGVFFFGGQFLCRQSGDDPEDYLARFGYRMNIKLENFEHPSVFLATILEP